MAKQKKIHEQLEDALDGRTNRWLHLKTNISQSELSRIRRGVLIPTAKMLARINEALGTNITLKNDTF